MAFAGFRYWRHLWSPRRGKPGTPTPKAGLEAGACFCFAEEWSSSSSHLGSDFSHVQSVKTLVRFPFLHLQKTRSQLQCHIQVTWAKNAALLGQLLAGWTLVQQTKESGTRADPKFLGRTSQRTRPSWVGILKMQHHNGQLQLDETGHGKPGRSCEQGR